MKKILIANIFGIGDVLFTTPLVSALKKGIDGVSIDYLCNARTRPVLESDPDIAAVHVYEKDDLLRLWKEAKPKFLSAVSGLFREIRQARYDAVFDLTLSREFGFFFMLAGIPKRIGLDYRKRGVFLTHKQRFTGFEGRHVIEYYRGLLEYMGITASTGKTRLVLDEGLEKWADEYLETKGAGRKRLIAIVPGGGASWGRHAVRKRWGPDRFARVADILAEQSGPVAILGDSSELDVCNEVAGNMAGNPLFVETGLGLEQYAALLSRCGLVVCNDGGPLHIAVALKVRTVSIFGPVDEKVYGPYPPSDRHRVITAREVECRPCYNRFRLPECAYNGRCLTGIRPETVAEACRELPGETGGIKENI